MCAGVDTFFLLYLERFGVRKLEAFFASLVAVMTISFGIMFFWAECPTNEVVLGTVLPRIRCAALLATYPAVPSVPESKGFRPSTLPCLYSHTHTPAIRGCCAGLCSVCSH